MKTAAVRHIERTPIAVVDRLAPLGMATVHEAQGRIGLMKPYMRPIYPGARIAGNAVTVLMHPGDNWMLHVAIELCQPGDVLVAACTADSTDGFFGDLLAVSAKAHGVRGLVIDGGVRDTQDLERMDFPVWSRAIHAEGTVKASAGSVNIPVVCAGQAVTPGDVVVADQDGVCVVARGHADQALTSALERQASEQAKRRRLAAGESSLDIYDMRARLQQAGLVYLDDLKACDDGEKT